MIKPLTLGNITFPVNLIQGPLAGISSAPFRRLLWQHSQLAFACTEMMSCKTILHQPTLARERLMVIDPNEGPICFQLSGSDPVELAEAVKVVTDAGADLIDLNCGCPVKKVRSRGAGSRLLQQPAKLYQLITAMKQHTHLPVSIKIRVEGRSGDHFHEELVNIISDAGADFVIVHGRHWTEHYETPCHYPDIQFFVERLKIPVIGNGDIACRASLENMLATGCAGVMISRATVGQPWLISQLIAEMSQQGWLMPGMALVGEMFATHVAELAILLKNEKFALLQARKLAKYYARRLANKAEFCQEMNKSEAIFDFKKLCAQYFG